MKTRDKIVMGSMGLLVGISPLLSAVPVGAYKTPNYDEKFEGSEDTYDMHTPEAKTYRATPASGKSHAGSPSVNVVEYASKIPVGETMRKGELDDGDATVLVMEYIPKYDKEGNDIGEMKLVRRPLSITYVRTQISGFADYDEYCSTEEANRKSDNHKHAFKEKSVNSSGEYGGRKNSYKVHEQANHTSTTEVLRYRTSHMTPVNLVEGTARVMLESRGKDVRNASHMDVDPLILNKVLENADEKTVDGKTKEMYSGKIYRDGLGFSDSATFKTVSTGNVSDYGTREDYTYSEGFTTPATTYTGGSKDTGRSYSVVCAQYDEDGNEVVEKDVDEKEGLQTEDGQNGQDTTPKARAVTGGATPPPEPTDTDNEGEVEEEKPVKTVTRAKKPGYVAKNHTVDYVGYLSSLEREDLDYEEAKQDGLTKDKRRNGSQKGDIKWAIDRENPDEDAGLRLEVNLTANGSHVGARRYEMEVELFNDKGSIVKEKVDGGGSRKKIEIKGDYLEDISSNLEEGAWVRVKYKYEYTNYYIPLTYSPDWSMRRTHTATMYFQVAPDYRKHFGEKNGQMMTSLYGGANERLVGAQLVVDGKSKEEVAGKGKYSGEKDRAMLWKFNAKKGNATQPRKNHVPAHAGDDGKIGRFVERFEVVTEDPTGNNEVTSPDSHNLKTQTALPSNPRVLDYQFASPFKEYKDKDYSPFVKEGMFGFYHPKEVDKSLEDEYGNKGNKKLNSLGDGRVAEWKSLKINKQDETIEERSKDEKYLLPFAQVHREDLGVKNDERNFRVRFEGDLMSLSHYTGYLTGNDRFDDLRGDYLEQPDKDEGYYSGKLKSYINEAVEHHIERYEEDTSYDYLDNVLYSGQEYATYGEGLDGEYYNQEEVVDKLDRYYIPIQIKDREAKAKENPKEHLTPKSMHHHPVHMYDVGLNSAMVTYGQEFTFDQYIIGNDNKEPTFIHVQPNTRDASSGKTFEFNERIPYKDKSRIFEIEQNRPKDKKLFRIRAIDRDLYKEINGG